MLLFDAGHHIIGEVEEGFLDRRVLELVQQRFCFGDVVPGTGDGVIDAAVAVNEVENNLKIGILQQVLLHYLPNLLAFGGGASFQGMNQWKGNLSLFEIVAYAFAELLLARHVIESVVHQLEGDSQLEAEVLECLLSLRRCLAEDCSRLTGSREKNRGFTFHHLDVALLSKVEVTCGDQLQHLPLGNYGGGCG